MGDSRLSVISASGSGYSAAAPAIGPSLSADNRIQVQVRTPPAGIAKINGTQTFVSWLTPADGQLHKCQCVMAINITSGETGGHCAVFWTCMGVAMNATIHGGGGGVGTLPAQLGIVADPGTLVSIQQDSALTAGASRVAATIDGA